MKRILYIQYTNPPATRRWSIAPASWLALVGGSRSSARAACSSMRSSFLPIPTSWCDIWAFVPAVGSRAAARVLLPVGPGLRRYLAPPLDLRFRCACQSGRAIVQLRAGTAEFAAPRARLARNRPRRFSKSDPRRSQAHGTPGRMLHPPQSGAYRALRRRSTGIPRQPLCVWNTPAAREAAQPHGPANGALVLLYHGSIVPERLPLPVLNAGLGPFCPIVSACAGASDMRPLVALAMSTNFGPQPGNSA